MQLKLFHEPNEAAATLWEQIDPDARRLFLQTLARAIAKIVAHPKPEARHER